MKNISKHFPGVFFLFAVFFAVGCGPDLDQNSGGPNAGSSEAPALQTEQSENSQITLAVRQELDKDDAVSPYRIEVETDDGVVRLRGEVPSTDIAERAQQVAKNVPGVRSVHSFLKVHEEESS